MNRNLGHFLEAQEFITCINLVYICPISWQTTTLYFLSHALLKQLPWTATNHIPKQCKQHPLIGNTLSIFFKMCQKLKISSIPGPPTPVCQNPDFPSGLDNTPLNSIRPHSDMRAGDFFAGDTLLPNSAFVSQTDNRQIPCWTYTQLQHFLHDPRSQLAYSRQHLPFKTSCSKTEPQ